MTDIPRRAVLTGGAAAAGLGLLPGRARAAEVTWNGAAPEPGASLRVLRWKQFIQAEYDAFMDNTRAFSKATGVKVRVDAESWDDIRPKSAVAANVGAGPDIIFGTLDDPFKFADKLIDLSEVAEYLGAKYGGWYKVARKYGMKGDRWIALPQGATGGTLNYRISAMHQAGFDEFPKDLAGFLKLCQGLKAAGKPPGFALGHATGDANGWVLWCLWAHGGKVVDDHDNVVIDSAETRAALDYAKRLYPTFIEGVLSWLDPSNNKAFLADQIGLTLNGISIYTVAKNSPEPALQAIAADMDHANLPIGPVGFPTEEQNVLNTYVYGYTKYPNAARDYLRAANGFTLALAMVETREALDSLDEIVATPGIDGIFIGPSDLAIALSNGATADMLGAPVNEAIDRIVACVKARGKFAGLFCGDGARAKWARAHGVAFVTVSTDLSAMCAGSRAELAIARS